jgi:hypothetical protein
VVALVVGEVAFEQVEVAVDGLDQTEGVGQVVEGAEAAGGDGPDPVGGLIVDGGGGHHGSVAFDAGLGPEAAADSTLASLGLALETGVHSKTSWVRTVEGRQLPRLFAETRGFSSLWASTGLGLRLFLV